MPLMIEWYKDQVPNMPEAQACLRMVERVNVMNHVVRRLTIGKITMKPQYIQQFGRAFRNPPPIKFMNYDMPPIDPAAWTRQRDALIAQGLYPIWKR